MKRIQYILTIVVLTMGMLGCTKLDEEVYDKIPEGKFPENDSQAALNVVPTYQALAPLMDDGGWWFWAQEVSSDEIAFPVRLTDWNDGGKWRVLHQHAWDNNTDAVNSMWSHLYDGVFEANKAIDLLPASDDPAALTIKAKLITMRAFYYYLLIDNYGDVPFVTSYVDAPEKPLKEIRANIFTALVTELEQQTQYLPVSGNNFSVTKGMAFTLLAKLYLNAEIYKGVPEWQMAEAYCDSVINLNKYSLQANPLDPFKADNVSSPENIFTIPFDESDLKGLRIHMRTLHYLNQQTYDMIAGPWNGFAAVEDHYKTYDPTDLRREGFLVGTQYSSSGKALFDETAEDTLSFNPEIPALVLDASFSFTQIRMSGARVAKFEIEMGADENMNNDFPLFRYADVLLMKAEAVIRQGENGDEFVNQIRNRAGLANWSGISLEMLLEERGREMFMEGHRRQDLIRFGKFLNAWWEKPLSSPDKLLFPIPQWAIDANSNLAL